MPIVRVLMYPGRTQQQKDDLAKAITDALERIANAKRDQTIVVIQEVRKEEYYVGANRAA
ncbi:4-oxalocrotonate tautomerase [Candidatus Bathyarchaeota archaeon]|nr:MAG: 4-oxalocrotonate tautomerase [Candidatus Bathyarchaeota archaeon]